MLLEAKIQGEQESLRQTIDLAFSELPPLRSISGVRGWDVFTEDTVPTLVLSAYPSPESEYSKFPVPLNEEETTVLVLRWLNNEVDKTKLPTYEWLDGHVYGYSAEIGLDYDDSLIKITPIMIGIGK